MRKKISTCLILGASVIILLISLWLIKISTITESFDNAWTNLGQQAQSVGGSIRNYVSDNTGSVWETNNNATDWEYASPGDIAQMRSRQSSASYLATKENPSLVDTINITTYNPTVFSSDRLINIGDPNTTGLNRSILNGANFNLNDVATDILNDNHGDIKWDKVIIDTVNTSGNTINVVKSPIPKSRIIDDACSSKGFLNSSFKEDICTVYAGDYNALNEKCQELSPENCSIPSCCVLINGNTCSAGNVGGPTYLTRNGESVDYTYYYYKKKCYGTGCDMAKQYEAACNKYGENTTGVSKQCMIKMFNIHGCPNSAPNDLINSSMVQSYSLSSKKYVNDYIKNAVSTLKFNIAQTDDPESKRLCFGEPKPKPKAIGSSTTRPGGPAPVESIDDLGGAINTGLDSLKFD
jgi:hypothetical protein